MEHRAKTSRAESAIRCGANYVTRQRIVDGLGGKRGLVAAKRTVDPPRTINTICNLHVTGSVC